ncbi:unannotated protein [freshwater metagenome]|uniref:Unannotated protein n=1 Tax=freshwater metagenome TaxID=449393 RepID=A0A6J7BN69_9ZZZZ
MSTTDQSALSEANFSAPNFSFAKARADSSLGKVPLGCAHSVGAGAGSGIAVGSGAVVGSGIAVGIASEVISGIGVAKSAVAEPPTELDLVSYIGKLPPQYTGLTDESL